MQVRRREGEMIIWTVSVWSQGGKVPSESPMRQADMASSSVTLTPSFSALRISCFRFSRRVAALPPLCNLFSSLLFFLLVLCCVLFYSALLWSVFVSCIALRLILLFTVLLYCPQLNKGNMSLYWQLIPCVRLCLRRFFSAEDPLGIGTQSKRYRRMNIQQARTDRQTEICGF